MRLLEVSVALIMFIVVEVSFILEFIHDAVGFQGISSISCNHVMKRAMTFGRMVWTF